MQLFSSLTNIFQKLFVRVGAIFQNSLWDSKTNHSQLSIHKQTLNPKSILNQNRYQPKNTDNPCDLSYAFSDVTSLYRHHRGNLLSCVIIITDYISIDTIFSIATIITVHSYQSQCHHLLYELHVVFVPNQFYVQYRHLLVHLLILDCLVLMLLLSSALLASSR